MGVFLLFAISCDKDDDNIDDENNTQETLNFGNFTDPRDGKVYKTVTLGSQEWMAENLAYEPSSGNYWSYNNDNSNVETYGFLYDWQTALAVCPTGWHLPSDEEWTELAKYLGGVFVAGGKLKATGTIEAGTGLWYAPNTDATNETGFSALPGGIRVLPDSFYDVGYGGSWWSATEWSINAAMNWGLAYNRVILINNGIGSGKALGCSVRCVRD